MSLVSRFMGCSWGKLESATDLRGNTPKWLRAHWREHVAIVFVGGARSAACAGGSADSSPFIVSLPSFELKLWARSHVGGAEEITRLLGFREMLRCVCDLALGRE
jgi:hypothetical protein